METGQLNGIVGTQQTVMNQDSDMHSQNESPATAPEVIAGCLDGPGQGVQIDLEMTTALPHHINQSLDEQSTREQGSGSANTQISHHRQNDLRHRAFPQQPSQRPHQSASSHHTKFQRQAPTSCNRPHNMAKDFNAEDRNSKYTHDISGYGQSQSQMHTTFSPGNPQLHDSSFNNGMNQASSHPGQIGVGPYFNQQPFSQYTPRVNQSQPTYRSAPNGYTDLQTCLPDPNPIPQEHLFHTGHQNQHRGPSHGSQQTTGASLWDQNGYDQICQVTPSPEVFGYQQNHHPRDHGSDQSSHPQYDEYEDQPFQQSIGEGLHGNQQQTHRLAPIESEDDEIVDGEVSQYNGDDSDHSNDGNLAKARGYEDGDSESINDSIFGEGTVSGLGSPELKSKHLSSREKSQLFVHGSDDEDEQSLCRNDKKDTLQARRHHRAKVSSTNDNDSGSDGVPRGATGFTMPGTVSEYLPSRYSGVSIPKSIPNKTPKTKNGRYISDASLRKRGLNRVQKNRVPKRAAGANDPENIKIVQLFDNDGIHSYDEIAELINDDRRKQGRAPDLTGCAVSARYSRTAPILYKAEGKVWVPPSKRKGPTTGPASIWNEELDLRLVSIKQEIDATTWQQVTNRFNQETGNHLTIEQISTRYAAI